MRRIADAIAGHPIGTIARVPAWVAHGSFREIRTMTLIRSISACAVLAAISFAEPFAQARAQDQAETPAPQAATGAEPASIDKRLRRIEDEIIDMRAMIGALQSFATGEQSAAAPDRFPAPEAQAPATGFPSAEAERGESEVPSSAAPGPQIGQLEIQIQALSTQLAEVVGRLDRLEQAAGLTQQGTAAPAAGPEAQESASQTVEPDPETPGFGTTTVERPDQPGADDQQPSWLDRPASAETDGAGDPEAQALFTQAYDAFLAQDYAAAREGFETFITEYPSDPLANTARYWLADAAFAEGDYVAAANNFVKVYNTAPSGEKSEQTLLKLAIALRRLERPESACDALSRLEGRLERMPDAFRERVQNERSRSGCS